MTRFMNASTLALILAASIFVQAPLRAQAPAAMRTEVQSFVRAYVDAHNRGDATALMDAVRHDADVSSVSDGEIQRGWEAIRTSTDQLAGKEGSFRLSIGTMDVTALGAGYALVVAPTTVVAATQQGPVEVHGAMTLVLQKTADGWKIVNEHYSARTTQ